MKPTIFFIGFHRAGTTSLHSLFLNIEGYKPCHDFTWWKYASTKYFNKKKLDSMGNVLSDGYDLCAKLLNLPVHELIYPDFTLLTKHYPNALFILNHRNVKSWLKSRINVNEQFYNQ